MTPAALTSPRRRPRPRCERCGGWLIAERYGGQRARRCINCGHTPDIPPRPPTPAEARAATERPPPLPRVRLLAGDKRNLATMMTELGLPVPPEWTPPKRKVKVRSEPEPAPADPPLVTAAGQRLLFDLDALAAGERDPRRRRGPRRKRRPAQGRQLSLYLPALTGWC